MQNNPTFKRNPKIKLQQKIKKQKLKTICTLDSYYNDSIDYLNSSKQNKVKNIMTNMTQSRKSYNNKKTSHQKSRNQAISQSRYRQYSISNNKKKTMSIGKQSRKRMQTQYNDLQSNNIKFMTSSIKKKLLFLADQNTKIDSYQIVKQLELQSNKNQEIYLVKVPNHNHKNTQSKVMIKIKHPPSSSSMKKNYQNEMSAWKKLSHSMTKVRQKDYFMKIDRIYKQKKEWNIICQQFHHVSWLNDQHFLFLNQFKTNEGLLNVFVKEVTKIIYLISQKGYTLYFKLNSNGKFQFNTKNQSIKIGKLSSMFKMRQDKEQLMKMAFVYNTPPEVVNYILFQMGDHFDRATLQYIQMLNEGWKINVWQLGILILELLNGGPLDQEKPSGQILMQSQKQLSIRYSYILHNIKGNLKILLSKMLSCNPDERPHPQTILRYL